MTTQRPDTDPAEQARLLAISIAAGIARHCPSPRAAHYSAAAIVAVGALSTVDNLGDVDAVAIAGQRIEELQSVSSICPHEHLCGIRATAEALSALLLNRWT